MNFRSTMVGLVLIGGFVLGACADTETAEERQVPPLNLEFFRGESQIAQGWMNVKTLQLHAATEKPDANDLVIRGWIEGGTFHPEGAVEGAAELPSAPLRGRVERARLELYSRRILYVKDGVSPIPPYLDGKFDAQTSLFYPDSRDIQRQAPAAAPDSAPAGK